MMMCSTASTLGDERGGGGAGNRRGIGGAMFTRTPVALGLAVGLLVAACGPSASDPQGTSSEGIDGAVLYGQSCASCHGRDLEGTADGPPFIDSIYGSGHHADAAFLLAVRRGVRSHHWDFGDMPRIDGLSDEQVAAIVEFVREHQAAAGID